MKLPEIPEGPPLPRQAANRSGQELAVGQTLFRWPVPRPVGLSVPMPAGLEFGPEDLRAGSYCSISSVLTSQRLQKVI